ncbi:MAG: VOC family protein [Chloroflexota bacterium]
MPKIERYSHGTPSWTDLATTDDEGAVAFYSALFGWKDNPVPMGPNAFYHMFELNGVSVSAMRVLEPAEREMGVPPHWTTYFSVDNVDEATERAAAAGGTVVMPCTDVFDAGRMSMVQDPQGAYFALWQAKTHIGSGLKNEPGTIGWTELMTSDLAAASSFYEKTLGVTSSKMGDMDYTLLNVGAESVAGAMGITAEMGPIPPHWATYFQVASVRAAAEKATGLGATVIAGPMEVPGVTWFAVLDDPQGGKFGIIGPENG